MGTIVLLGNLLVYSMNQALQYRKQVESFGPLVLVIHLIIAFVL